MKTFVIKNMKPLLIMSSVVLLQVFFGFDPKFSIINLLWLLV